MRGLRSIAATLLGFIVLLSAKVAAQQHGRIEGRVTAAGDTAGLERVTVLAEGSNRSTVTDFRGFYRLSEIPAGAVVVLVRRLGFEPDRRSVTVQSGESTRADFTLAQVALVMSDVVVSAAREEERRVEVPIAIGTIDSATLRATRPAHPSEIMNRVPGVWVSVTGGEGHMTAIRQPLTTDPVYLYLEDGIPTRSTGFFNHNALYEINLPQASRIEVTKGPANALYGSDAIGGVVNVSTRRPSQTPELSLSLEGGQNAWGRGLLSASNSWGRTGIRADLNVTRTDGWRQFTEYDRQAGTVRWDQDLGSGARLKTLGTFSLIDQQTAGSSAVSLDDYLNNPTTNYTPFSLRQVKAARISTAIERATATTLLSVTPYWRYDWMRLIPNWSLSYDPQDYTSDNHSVGLLAKLRYDLAPLRTRIIVGTDVDLSPGGQVETNLTTTRNGTVFTSYAEGPRTYDYSVTFYGVSPYVQLETSPMSRLRVTAGVRVDRTGFDYETHLAAVDTGRWRRPADTAVSYSHVSPKLGATYEFHPAFNVFVSHRHGFRTPSQGQLFRQGSTLNTVGLKPVKANDYEGGIRGRIGPRVDYDVTAYSLSKTDDILSFTRADGSTEVQNAGKTSHKGIEVGLGLVIVAPVRIDVSYSYNRHFYELWQPRATSDLSGFEMANAPRHLGNATLTVAPAALNGGQVSLQGALTGSYWMDADNTHRYAGHKLLHARANVPVIGRFNISARVMNITNVRYAETSGFTTARGEEFAPGMPRTIYAGMEYQFR